MIVVGTATYAAPHHQATQRARSDAPSAVATPVLTDPAGVEDSLVSAARRHLTTVGAAKDYRILAGVQRLAPSDAGIADGVRVELAGSGRSQFAVFVGRDVDPPEGPTFCPPIGGAELACSERAATTGHVVDEVQIARALPAAGAGAYQLVRDPASLTPADYPDIRLTREAEIHRPDGTTTAVVEYVYGPRSLRPSEALSESAGSMESLALDERISWAALTAPAP